MRDPKRIDVLLAELGKAWKRFPDLRFGQFMYNFFSECGIDPFYPEDGGWMAALQAFSKGEDPAEALKQHRSEPLGRIDRAPDEFEALWQQIKRLEPGKKSCDA